MREFGLLLGLLFLAAVAVKFWWLIAAVTVVVLTVRWAVRAHGARNEVRAGLVARADYEHWLVMNGDQRGVFGAFPPAVL